MDVRDLVEVTDHALEAVA